MNSQKILILTDNAEAMDLALDLQAMHKSIEIFQSPKGALENVPKLDVKKQAEEIVRNYTLVISLHCKQIFPAKLVGRVRCVNVHPGYNPYNRGWFPQVFSIMNGLPCGVTIHEIDEKLDHGKIIVQEQCAIQSWDTSGSAYRKIMDLERVLLMKHFDAVLSGKYNSVPADHEGNVNYKKDYERLKRIELNEEGTYGEFLNRLRALTHGNYNNAYFEDSEGRKVFVRLTLQPEKQPAEQADRHN